MRRAFRSLFGALVVTKLRTPAGTNAIVGLLWGASSAEVLALVDGDDDPLHNGDGALALYTANVFIWRRPRLGLAGG